MTKAIPAAAAAARPVRMDRAEPAGLRRIRSVSYILDQCIPLPFGWRVGIDPILGLVPWVGDLAMTLCSFFLIFESAKLGLPKRILLRMMLNVAVESLAGAVPLLGDLFDAAWKANVMNRRLAEQSWHPGLEPRSTAKVGGTIGAVFVVFFALAASWLVFTAWLSMKLVAWLLGQF